MLWRRIRFSKEQKAKEKETGRSGDGALYTQNPGMHCQNCVNSVTRGINSIDGASAKVSLRKKSAEVSCDRDIDKADLIRAVESAGFEVESIS